MNLNELPDMSAAYKQVQEKLKDYDGDGKVESGSKEHAGVVHNAIQKKKGLKPDGKDTRKEEVEVEEYIDFLVTEGYDCSDLTWDDMCEEYESLDEGLRSAVKRLLGGKKKEEPAKPMSRGDQLRKKYNVGPEKSDTSAKAQILKKTRAKADSDQKEFGGSRYSKGVADRSKAAHERQLKGGYSKYGADDKRGSGNKAAKRAAALKKEEVEIDEAEQRVKAKADKKMKVYGGPAYIKKPKNEEVEIDEGKFTGSKSSVDRNSAADSGGRNAAERRKDRRTLATYYGAGGKQMAIDRAKKERDEKRAARKESFAFSEADLELFEQYGEEIDALTDEQLIDVMEDFILEIAQDDQDLIEICEHLDAVEMLTEEERDAGAMARAKLNKPAGPSRMDRIKSAAKKAGDKVGAAAKKVGAAAKQGIKAAGKSAAANAGKAVGTFQANRIKSKRAELSKPAEKKPAPKSSSSDDDGTGGKLDGVLSSIRKSKGTSSSSSSSSDSGSSSSGGGESSSSSSSSGGAKKPGLLRRLGGAIKRGLKKAVGKTSRLVSKGSDKLAKRLGEDYDQIAHLYESGLFSIQEIENVIEEGYKEIDKKKETAMYRRAGNLSREALSKGLNSKKGSKAQDKSGKIVSAITSQKEKERFNKMADVKARSNYGG